MIGSVVGPAPYPALVRDLQRVIGDEARSQALEAEGALPQRVIACVGGGSNAIGSFHAFLDDPVELIGVEAGGEGLESGHHGASLVAGTARACCMAPSPSVLADDEGQILEAHSVSAGLDYPGVGPEHAYLRDSGRARPTTSATDAEALRAFRELARLEGIIPALEPAHAIAWLLENGGGDGYDVLTLSGRGDKDMDEVTGEARRPRWLTDRRPQTRARRDRGRLRGRPRRGPRGADAVPDGRLSRPGDRDRASPAPTPMPGPT